MRFQWSGFPLQLVRIAFLKLLFLFKVFSKPQNWNLRQKKAFWTQKLLKFNFPRLFHFIFIKVRQFPVFTQEKNSTASHTTHHSQCHHQSNSERPWKKKLTWTQPQSYSHSAHHTLSQYFNSPNTRRPNKTQSSFQHLITKKTQTQSQNRIFRVIKLDLTLKWNENNDHRNSHQCQQNLQKN